MAGLNFFDKMFDFNQDGKLGAFETGVKWGTITHIMDEDERREILEDAGLDSDDYDDF